MNTGQLVKVRRTELNMTQGELAEGISTQAMISKIERNLLNPSSKTLEKIAHKLKVPVSYFYGEKDVTTSEKLLDLENNLRKLLNQGEYDQVARTIKENKSFISNLQKESDKYFFLWVKGVLVYYQDNNIDEAISLLENLLNKVISFSDLYFDILSSLGVIYYEIENFITAQNYFELALKEIDESKDFKIVIRTLYNYALNLESLNRDKDAIEATLQAIEIAIENQSLYMLGYLYFYKAYLLRKKRLYSDALESYEHAYFVFKITNYQKMLTLCQIEIQEVKDIEKGI